MLLAVVLIRIGAPEFRLARGALRSGKYKYLANEWCSGWYTFHLQTQAVDGLTTDSTVCDGSPCSDCSQGSGCIGLSHSDYLFDLEADPREERNLIEVYPEVRRCCCWV